MKIVTFTETKAIIETLKQGKIVCAPTDTIIGLLGRADSQTAYARLVEIKERPRDKAFITLAATVSQITNWVEIGDKNLRFINNPKLGPVTVILPATNNCPFWLQADDKTIAIRLIKDPQWQTVIRETGPVIAPSANRAGAPPAQSIEEAINTFGGRIDLYVNETAPLATASSIVKLRQDEIEVVREGSVDKATLVSAWQDA